MSASEGACRGGPGQQGVQDLKKVARQWDMKEVESFWCNEVNYIKEGIGVCRVVAHIGCCLESC